MDAQLKYENDKLKLALAQRLVSLQQFICFGTVYVIAMQYGITVKLV